MAKYPKEIEAFFKKLDAARRKDAEEIYEFIRQARPDLEPFVIGNYVGFGKFHYKGKTCEGDWFMVGMACNKASLGVYSCGVNEKGMLPEQYASQLGKVSVGKSCIRFKKWGDVNQPVLRKLLKESKKFAFD
ncbi:MAG: DUF1801 domain-containing protein [Fimbriimonadaceae bacterium]